MDGSLIKYVNELPNEQPPRRCAVDWCVDYSANTRMELVIACYFSPVAMVSVSACFLLGKYPN
jgi:hypothetical protein